MSFTFNTEPIARKQYTCAECHRLIAPGVKHFKCVHKSDITNDRVSQLRYCMRCTEEWRRKSPAHWRVSRPDCRNCKGYGCGDCGWEGHE